MQANTKALLQASVAVLSWATVATAFKMAQLFRANRIALLDYDPEVPIYLSTLHRSLEPPGALVGCTLFFYERIQLLNQVEQRGNHQRAEH